MSTQKLTNKQTIHSNTLPLPGVQDAAGQTEQKHNIIIQHNPNYLKTSSFKQSFTVATKLMKFNVKATLFPVTLCICQSIIIYML